MDAARWMRAMVLGGLVGAGGYFAFLRASGPAMDPSSGLTVAAAVPTTLAPAPPSPVAPTGAPTATSTSASTSAWTYVIDARGRGSIVLPAPQQQGKQVTVTTDVAAGTIRLDVADIARTRGEVKVDLGAISTHTLRSDGGSRADPVVGDDDPKVT